MARFAWIVVLAACGSKSTDAPAVGSAEPVPAAAPVDAAAPKPIILPDHGMACTDMGGRLSAWWPDGHMSEATELRALISGREGNTYDWNYVTREIRRVVATGSGDKVAPTPDVQGENVEYVIESPTAMLAVINTEDHDALFELVGGAWKKIELPPRPANEAFSLVGAGHGPGGVLWVGRTSGLWRRGDSGAFEEIKGAKDNYELATTAGGVYILRRDELVRYDAAGKPTKLASWLPIGPTPALIANGTSVVAASGEGIGFNTLFLADDAAKTAKKIPLAGTGGKLLALDNANRVWLRDGADFVALSATERRVFAHGTLANMPYEDGSCTLFGGGFSQLPGAGKQQTATLVVVIHGGEGLDIELCERPDDENPKGTPCAGHSDRIAAKLDKDGQAKLTVPVGKYEPAVNSGGAWFVVDMKTYAYNSAAPSCELAAGKTCTVELSMPKK